jgi:hypothetical protein
LEVAPFQLMQFADEPLETHLLDAIQIAVEKSSRHRRSSHVRLLSFGPVGPHPVAHLTSYFELPMLPMLQGALDASREAPFHMRAELPLLALSLGTRSWGEELAWGWSATMNVCLYRCPVGVR